MQRSRVYTFRYVPASTKVFYVGRKGPTRRSTGTALYTEPFYSRETKEVRNALLAYCNVVAAEHKRKEVLDGEVLTDSIDELKYTASLLRVPLVVEVVTYCNISDKEVECVEVFYFNKI